MFTMVFEIFDKELYDLHRYHSQSKPLLNLLNFIKFQNIVVVCKLCQATLDNIELLDLRSQFGNF